MSAHEHRTVDADCGEPMPVDFPLGLYGFPACRRFSLAAAPRQGFYWLQSLEHPALAFMLADPFLFFDSYAVDLGVGDADALAATDAGELAVLVTVTLPSEGADSSTVNLQGPLIINTQKRLGRQIVLNQPSLGVREPLPPHPAAAAA